MLVFSVQFNVLWDKAFVNSLQEWTKGKTQKIDKVALASSFSFKPSVLVIIKFDRYSGRQISLIVSLFRNSEDDSVAPGWASLLLVFCKIIFLSTKW